ncbi:ChbG/HpnK family deacetylase [Phreatobacter sp.]|uniref:ChbG/HpnK family deacetylase n=1 Tax=Phreatobacter sp. TaxID=1966341 RepID=UPI003F6EFDE2
MKRLILCADDYGLSPGVSRAIRELAAARRLNATSVMAPGEGLAAEAEALAAVAPQGFRIGLHLTLTGGLSPLTRPALAAFPALPALMARAFAARLVPALLDTAAIAAEFEAQFAAFRSAFGQAPAFVDGHQHVHLLPGIRPLVIGATRRNAPGAWLRQCSGPRGAGRGGKARLIAALSAGLAREATAAGLPVNPAFSGAYAFGRARFSEMFPQFLEGQPDGVVVMVHPGHVDAVLGRVDRLVEPRAEEYGYLISDALPDSLAREGFALA